MRRLLLPLALLLPLLALGLPDQAGASDPRPLRIEVLSNRADLISGGDALVAVSIPKRLDAGQVRVRVGDTDVTRRFKVREDGQYVGLLNDLADDHVTAVPSSPDPSS